MGDNDDRPVVTDRDEMGTEERDSVRGFWWATAISLLALCLVLTICSFTFVHGENHTERPIVEVVLLLVFGGALYSLAAARSRSSAPALRWVVVIGVACRVILLVGSPIQEDDIYRYIWDGQVASLGVSPYAHAPADVAAAALELGLAEFTLGSPSADEEAAGERLGFGPDLVRLAHASRRAALAPIFSKINHPEYLTVYPPVTQGVFALHAALVPANWGVHAHLVAMKALLTAIDCGVIIVLIGLLRHCGLAPGLVLFYAWCPIVLKEIANSGHMDAIPTLLLVAAVRSLVSGRSLLAGLMLGAAIGAKFYALVLLPIFLWRLGWRSGVICAAGTMMVLAAVHFGIGSGIEAYRGTLVAFSLNWENNDAVFTGISAFWSSLFETEKSVTISVGSFSHTATLSHLFSLATAVAVTGAVLVSTLHRLRTATSREVVRRVFLLLVTLVLVGPVGFPWYFIWCLPFIAWTHLRSWTLLACVLPLYYLRFWFAYHYEEGLAGFEYGPEFFDFVVVPIEFGVLFAALIVEAALARRRQAQETERV